MHDSLLLSFDRYKIVKYNVVTFIGRCEAWTIITLKAPVVLFPLHAKCFYLFQTIVMGLHGVEITAALFVIKIAYCVIKRLYIDISKAIRDSCIRWKKHTYPILGHPVNDMDCSDIRITIDGKSLHCFQCSKSVVFPPFAPVRTIGIFLADKARQGKAFFFYVDDCYRHLLPPYHINDLII